MTVADRLRRVAEAIERSAVGVGRTADDVTLIAITKTVPIAMIREAQLSGLNEFGENYLQEAQRKMRDIQGASWHYVGRIQSNKAPAVGSCFDCVHTVDRRDTAVRLVRDRPGDLDFLIEVNIAREPEKAGILPEHLDEFVESVYHLPGLRLRGLMTMGPANPNQQESRPYFAEMRSLLDRLCLPKGGWLSMGMSADYVVAIQEGATHIRLGSVIFGPRQK